MIYLDNAATTLHKPECVIQAVVQAMQSMGNSGRSAHEEALTASRVIFDTREKLARLFRCARPDHVIFTANSTEALNIAIAGALSEGDHVISTDCEHNSVLRPLYRHGNVDFVPAGKDGTVNYNSFTELIKSNTRAIVCTHASNLTGNVLDIARIGQIAHANGLLFIVDASQTAGVFPVDMERMHIDVLCFTGHKSLLGPQGTGGLCVAEGVELRPWKVGGTGVQTYLEHQPEQYPTRLEAGTLNGHGIAGLSAALDYIAEVGIDSIRQQEQMLARRFYEGVAGIDGVTVYGDFSTTDRAPIVSLNVLDYDSSEVSDVLAQEYGIATRPGAHCAPRLHRALGTVEQGAVRFSFSHFNTESEVDTAIAAIREVAK
ncbi:MAG: aminotransferase class V-fold PLP-dependent enzyme [Clostridiales bacterium]|nr:aminotransferase class V-fold PLP-dependent enzyme [Candidatus Cacconaster stercorequi]